MAQLLARAAAIMVPDAWLIVLQHRDDRTVNQR